MATSATHKKRVLPNSEGRWAHLAKLRPRRSTVGFDIATVEFGWPVGMPLCRSLGGGLWEVRSNLAHGRIGRVIFCAAHGQMVLLHAFVKKAQKTPSPDLDIGRKRQGRSNNDQQAH
ncbi:type II toxin-antitoxin system RelE/ParE family toxin [Mesorhizobium sp. B2-3-5]|uniref:type II toxin-antitoxin system RelE/ParE family toxin n=1 Tax=Mesorhizobium sp. B2-3-5 TaxID=2589958 RepID=UPI00112B0A3E|nr:type II toxin-antitoxin system RelE/ParE family toxin [Mesorhizobium sp. B2-3-5]TPM25290.1 type II toxin-antitoxin system RelE/ParE family toxin [Mesorhizobium sp. B2-3-5]